MAQWQGQGTASGKSVVIKSSNTVHSLLIDTMYSSTDNGAGTEVMRKMFWCSLIQYLRKSMFGYTLWIHSIFIKAPFVSRTLLSKATISRKYQCFWLSYKPCHLSKLIHLLWTNTYHLSSQINRDLIKPDTLTMQREKSAIKSDTEWV